jgi:hypothetical protein
VLGATFICVLWLGLAMPGLKLVPGLGGLADQRIAISLQSALLGIDDGGGRPAESAALAASKALGLPVPRFVRSDSRHSARLLVDLRASATPAPTPAAERSASSPAPAPTPSPPVDPPVPPSTEPPLVPKLPVAAPPDPAQRSSQSVTFTSDPPDPARVGGGYAVAATASSGLPVTFSADGACTASGPLVSLSSVGTCTVTARQPGNGAYLPAHAQQAFAVVAPAPRAQTIRFTSVAPELAVVGTRYAVSAAASSALPVSFAGTAGVCSVSGSTVSLVGPGTCSVTASQGGNGGYLPAPDVQQSFPVVARSLSVQTITFVSTPPAAATVGDSYHASAAASSGLPVALSASASSLGVCTVAGATVSLVGPGTCTVDADQAGNASYLPAPRVEQSFAVASPAPRIQTISFTSTPPSGALVGGAPYWVSATASSSLPVSFSLAPASAGVCSLAGSVVNLVGPGTCVVYADQSGNGSFAAAPRVQQSFVVGIPSLSVQSITFTSTPPSGAVVGGTYAVSASASSGLPVSFGVSPSSSGVCTVAGSLVSLVGPGTCVVTADQPGNASYAPAPQVQQSFTVSPPPPSAQTIVFTSTPPALAVPGDTYAIAASASSGLPVVFAADAASAGICTVSGSTVTAVAPGTCLVNANQAGNGAYLAAPQAQQSYGIGTPAPSVQSITFTSTAPSGAVVGDSYGVSASASSGLAVAFSADAASAGVCTLSGATVSLVGAGTCVVDANQPGDASYAAAPQVQQSFTVSPPPPSAQTIVFTSVPPSGAVVGGPDYTVTATASSGLPVAFAAAFSSSGICTVSGSSVSLVGPGTCMVTADQAGNGSYLAAPQVQQSFAIDPPAPSPQSITFTSTAPSNAHVGDTYVVSATASSGLTVEFSVDASSAGSCSVSGSTISLLAPGTCVVTADQPGNSSYLAAPQEQQSFAVTPPPPASQTITFTSTPPGGAVVGDTYVVSASASSGLAVVFSADGASAGICTVSGSTVSMAGPGTCVVDADQAGNGSYDPAPQVQQSFTVSAAPQTIAFTSTPPSGATVGDTYVASAHASSGLPVSFSVGSSAGVCTVSGSTVSLVGAGTCVVDADQPGNSTHRPAPRAHQSFSVSAPPPASQTIAFTSTPPSGATVGGSYAVSATASSGLAVAFSAAGSSAGVCTVSGSIVSFVGAGTCVVDADQAGNASYDPAPQVHQSFAVSPAPPGSQTITFTSTPPAGAVVGDTYEVTATASSGLPVSFSAAASSSGVCSVSGSTVSLVGPGTCVVNADQAGDATHAAAPQVQQSFSVSPPPPGSQSIAFTSTPPSSAFVGGTTYTVTASASSGLAVVFSADSASAGICTVSGSTVSFVGTGTCVVDANQSGNGSYAPAPQVQQSFAVGATPPSPQTITFTSTAPSGATVGGATYTVSATASSGLAVAFGLAPSSAGVCGLSGSTLSFVGAGTCTINADQAGNASYQPAPRVQQSFAVAAGSSGPSAQTISFTTSPPSRWGRHDWYHVAAVATSGLPVSFSIDPSTAGNCEIFGGSWVVKTSWSGTCRINANQGGDANWLPAPQVQQSG